MHAHLKQAMVPEHKWQAVVGRGGGGSWQPFFVMLTYFSVAVVQFLSLKTFYSGKNKKLFFCKKLRKIHVKYLAAKVNRVEKGNG